MSQVTLFSVFSLLVISASTVFAMETACQKELRESIAASNQTPPRVGQRLPVCDSEGNYAPKQCSGSQCYCVMTDGALIDRYSVNRWEAQDQNCKCARDEAEYSKLRIFGKIHFCSANGNYEPIQCTGSVCYCADENGKQVGTTTVNIGLMRELKC